jgi:hypothetical protein
MAHEHTTRSKAPLWLLLGVLVVTGLALTRPGRAAAHGFLSSLRIERPKRVTAAYAPPAGSRYTRRTQDMVARMVTAKVDVTENEPDQAVADTGGLAAAAGFTPLLAPTDRGTPTLVVTGARTIAMSIQRSQLSTILREAGAPADLPASLDGATITMKTPRGVRAQYGHCPAPEDTTLQGQFQGRPPTTAENRDCIVLTEQPEVSATLPSGLDVDRLVNIALEVSGMSPVEARRFRAVFDARAALSLDLPRFVRSHDFVAVRGSKGVLMNQGWRRGPSYTLVWADGDRVYSLSGWGASADAVPLADSLR